jgi:hypothetical protein
MGRRFFALLLSAGSAFLFPFIVSLFSSLHSAVGLGRRSFSLLPACRFSLLSAAGSAVAVSWGLGAVTARLRREPARPRRCGATGGDKESRRTWVAAAGDSPEAMNGGRGKLMKRTPERDLLCSWASWRRFCFCFLSFSVICSFLLSVICYLPICFHILVI